MLIGADEDVPAELGIELEPERETLQSAAILRELKLAPSRHPLPPLTEGDWR